MWVAGVGQRECDGAAECGVATGKVGRVGQLGAAADDDGAARDRVDGWSGRANRLIFVSTSVLGAIVVGVAAVYPAPQIFADLRGQIAAGIRPRGRGVCAS